MRLLALLLAILLAGCTAEPEPEPSNGATTEQEVASGDGPPDRGEISLPGAAPMRYDDIRIQGDAWRLHISDAADIARHLDHLQSGSSLGPLRVDLDGMEHRLDDATVVAVELESVADRLQAVVVLA